MIIIIAVANAISAVSRAEIEDRKKRTIGQFATWFPRALKADRHCLSRSNPQKLPDDSLTAASWAGGWLLIAA